MKHLILTPLFAFLCLFGSAQVDIKTFEKDSGRLEIAYFPNGRVSTRKMTPRGMYSRIEGYAKAYNTQGKLIYETTISTMGGSGGIYFKYHPNGVIQSVQSTFQPDGGIQRYDVTRYYDDQGNFLHEVDNSWHTNPRILFERTTTVQPTEKKEEKKSETIACAVIVQLKGFVENLADVPVQVKVIPKAPNTKPFVLTVKPGERIFAVDYIMAEQFVDPTTYYHIELDGENKQAVKMGKWEMQKKSDQLGYYVLKISPIR